MPCKFQRIKTESCSKTLRMAGLFLLNEDVVVVILLHLPAKSLIRFKLVCKHWLSIISAQQFCHLYSLRHPKPLPSLILRTHTSHCFYFNPVSSSHKLVPYTVTVPNSRILNSCNGLMLLQSVHPDPVEYHVYNSTTKQSRTISLTDSEDFPKIMGLTLAFDPSKSPHYKIVCVRAKMKAPSARERHCRIEVFNSQSLTWRVCLEQLTAPTGANFSTGVHCNNVIHWDNYPRAHLYYNINKNVVGNLPHAQVPWHGGGGGAASHCQLQESNGLLYHFIIVSHLGDTSIAVYELQEDYSQWLLKYHDEVGQLPGKSRILSYIKGEEGQSCTMLTHVPGKITLYSFLDKRSKEIVDLTNQPFYQEDSVQFDSTDVFHFGETLAPV
ncbi:F-box protein At5g07610-like [Salvia splendens]|uniref:F-box protein At5g07610-like n=1 Tax=Salvia splendens TaxID=180675 RepID=UPI001C253F52|nr:F-box protein At5g07610-like [Salvia splendens]